MKMQEYTALVMEWLSTTGLDILFNIIGAIIILVIGIWVAKLIRHIFKKALRKRKIDETLIGFAANIGYALIMAFVIIAALAQLGVQTATFVAVIAAAGLAVGLALQGSLSNFAAGVMIVGFRYLRIGDYVQAGGTGGTVDDIHIFHTQLMTPDNRVVIVPNRLITSAAITNYSKMDTRRVDIVISVNYGTDLTQAKALLEEILASDERVLKEPEAVVVVGDLGQNGVDFWVRPWSNAGDYWPLKWDLLQTIKARLEDNDIAVAFQQVDVHMPDRDDNSSAADKAVA